MDLQQINDEIDEILEECSLPNWNEYDSDPVLKETGEHMRCVLSLVDEAVPMPDIVPDSDGDLSADWDSEDDIGIYLTVSADGEAYFNIFYFTNLEDRSLPSGEFQATDETLPFNLVEALGSI